MVTEPLNSYEFAAFCIGNQQAAFLVVLAFIGFQLNVVTQIWRQEKEAYWSEFIAEREKRAHTQQIDLEKPNALQRYFRKRLDGPR